MKKKYIQPIVEVIEYNFHQPMLTTSVPLSETDTDIQFAPEREFDFDDFLSQ
jgi:hypothetical protein